MIPTAQNAHTNAQQWLLGRGEKIKNKKFWGLEIAKENCLLGGGEKTKNKKKKKLGPISNFLLDIFQKREREHV
jgi:hypothetical protein